MSIGTTLRSAREAQKRSLDEVAEATKINKKFLEAIEQDRSSVLPPTYVRAFIRSFAREVGIDSDELLKSNLQQEVTPPDAQKSVNAPIQLPIQLTPDTAAPAHRQGANGDQNPRLKVKGLVPIIGIIIVGLVVTVVWLRSEREQPAVREILFEEVMKEQTNKQLGVAPAPDTSRRLPGSSKMLQSFPKQDSLTLEASTTEGVWVHVVIDGGDASEYNLPAKFKITWKAAENFTLAIGNPGAVRFTLNGRKLGRLKEGSKPVKNIVVSHETLVPTDSLGR